MKFLLNLVRSLFRRQEPVIFQQVKLGSDDTISRVGENVKNSREEIMPSTARHDDGTVRYDESKHDTNTHENEALIVLLKKLLITTREWSIQYGCESVPPGVLLQQACTMIDAVEIIFRDD